MSSRGAGAALAASLILVSACAGTPAPTGVPTPAGSGPTASTSSAAPCNVASPSASVASWWQDRVFYEVLVRSFADSDGDGIGDLRGLTAHLDDLNDGDPTSTDDLGITGLWLMPVADSPSYHGYDVVDYGAVEPDYGTADDLRALVSAAHERGIAVIVDLVINHTSREHPWFQDARVPGSVHDDWYVWADEHPGIARSDGSRVWHPDGERFYYGYFWEGMPDLNLENPAVTAELDAVADRLVEDFGIDGFRIDAARHLIEDGRRLENTDATMTWLEGFRERIKARHPEALVLGEVWDASSMSARYVRDGALDLTFDFGLASATITSLRSGEGGSLGAGIREAAELYPAGGLATFLTNHDQDRVMTELGHDVAAARLAAAFMLTGGGTPFLYYGEEIGLTGAKPDERIRTPMRWDASTPGAGFTTGTPWQPFGDDPSGTDVATQRTDAASLLRTYRDLIALRAANASLSTGGIVPVTSDDPSVVAFIRHGTGDAGPPVLVVANVADEPVDGPIRLSLEAGPLCGTTGVEVLYGSASVAAVPEVTGAGGFEAYAPLERLGPRELVVIGFAP